jgi:hypothetical protein
VFLIKEGTVSILVQPEGDGVETQVALRFQGDLSEKPPFLQRNVARTASVEVVSSDAVLIRLTRNDVFSLLRDDPALHDAITLLWELAAGRQAETFAGFARDRVTVVKTKSMSVIGLAIFTTIRRPGRATWKSTAQRVLIRVHRDSSHDNWQSTMERRFADQGDGFRSVFQVANHDLSKLFICARRDPPPKFEGLRGDVWRHRTDAFGDFGLWPIVYLHRLPYISSENEKGFATSERAISFPRQ